MYTISKDNKNEFLLAFLYAFRFIFKIYADNNGNYDLFFLFAIVVFLSHFKYKKICKAFFASCIILSGIEFTTIIGAPYQIDIIKGGVFIVKLSLCIVCYAAIKYRYIEINLRKFLNYTSIFFLFETIYAIISKNNITWRLIENRMELFYLEPSELGAFVSVLIIIQVYYLREDIINHQSIKNSLMNLLIFAVDIILSQSASAVVYLIVCISIILLYEIFSLKIQMRTIIKILAVAVISILIWFYLFIGDSYISLRMQAIMSGSDSSFNTRITNSFETVTEYYSRYGFIGCGFGNQTSEYGMSFFNLKAVNYSTCSAVATFALEGGIIAAILAIIFLLFRLRDVIRSKSEKRLRWALFVFVILYIVGGGYLTNPVIWILLGISVSTEIKNFGSTATKNTLEKGVEVRS